MHRKEFYYFLYVLTLSLLFFQVALIAHAELVPDTSVLPVIDTQGMPWHDDWHYITYLFKDSNDQLCFRTYPFTTINSPGFYTLANNVTEQITITVPNVTLDMNGCTVNGGITISDGLSNITIFNGTVSGASDGIIINAGCKNITLKKITAKNCTRGVAYDRVNDGIISHCDFILNTTGLHLDTSRNIYVESCTAHANLQAGFSLLSSTTCSLVNCQAISTGDGNTNLFGNQSNVFGFVSSNGYGNIFERCIANSTQALTATAPETIVAGFGLRGTEGCSKIMQCEAGNGTAGLNGLTTPYGIWLETQFDGLTTATSTNPGNNAADSVLTVNWSPDGAYLAIGGGQIDAGASNGLRVYRFDRTLNALIQVASVNPGGGSTADNINEIAWSPDGQFLAVGGQFLTSTVTTSLIIYRFDRSNETLTEIISANPTAVEDSIGCLSWSPDGRYLAVGGTFSTNDLYVYRFDKVGQTITPVATANPNGGALDDFVLAVDWSPDGTYLAVGSFINTDPTASLFMYLFNRNGESLTQVAAANPDEGNPGDSIFSVRWSPNGTYLAVGGLISDVTGNDLFLYKFNRSTNQLIVVDSLNPGGGAGNDAVYDIDWSADSTYLAIGGNLVGVTSNLLYVYKFNPALEKLTQVNSVSAGGPGDLFAVQWSPDGQYLAVGGAITGDDLIIYNALRFPLQNVITNNTIYCDSGGNGPYGIGISGSSIGNYMVGNTAYANPLNLPIVGSNYQFVCNVFNPLFGDEPTALQNITLNSKTPLPSRFDIPAGLNRLEVLAQSLVDNLL